MSCLVCTVVVSCARSWSSGEAARLIGRHNLTAGVLNDVKTQQTNTQNVPSPDLDFERILKIALTNDIAEQFARARDK